MSGLFPTFCKFMSADELMLIEIKICLQRLVFRELKLTAMMRVFELPKSNKFFTDLNLLTIVIYVLFHVHALYSPNLN